MALVSGSRQTTISLRASISASPFSPVKDFTSVICLGALLQPATSKPEQGEFGCRIATQHAEAQNARPCAPRPAGFPARSTRRGAEAPPVPACAGDSAAHAARHIRSCRPSAHDRPCARWECPPAIPCRAAVSPPRRRARRWPSASDTGAARPAGDARQARNRFLPSGRYRARRGIRGSDPRRERRPARHPAHPNCCNREWPCGTSGGGWVRS